MKYGQYQEMQNKDRGGNDFAKLNEMAQNSLENVDSKDITDAVGGGKKKGTKKKGTKKKGTQKKGTQKKGTQKKGTQKKGFKKKTSKWIQHVLKYSHTNNIPFRKALKLASRSYKK